MDIYQPKLPEDKDMTKQISDIQNEVYANNCFRTPCTNYISASNFRQNNSLIQGIPRKIPSSTHTPIMNNLNRNKIIAMCSNRTGGNSEIYTSDYFTPPITKRNYNSEANYKKDKTMVEEIPTVSAKHSYCTPLKNYIGKYENDVENGPRGKTTERFSQVSAIDFKKPIKRTNNYLQKTCRKDGGIEGDVSSMHSGYSMETPMKHYMNKYENRETSKITSDCMTKASCGSIKIRRKVPTPNYKNSPQSRAMEIATNLYYRPLAATLADNMPYYQSRFKKNLSNSSYAETKGKYQIEDSMVTSPELSIHEAATLAKDSYFHTMQ